MISTLSLSGGASLIETIDLTGVRCSDSQIAALREQLPRLKLIKPSS